MKSPWRVGWALALGLVVLSGASRGRADDSAVAQALFDQGKAAMAVHDYAVACQKFEDSLRTEYALGTLANLANCYEQEKRLASAWSKYLELASKARATGQTDRARFGQQRAAALAPRLSSLVISVLDAARVPGLRVKRDGTELGEAEWGTPLPADAGAHTVTASAPGRESWSISVEVTPDAKAVTVSVPELQKPPAATVASPPPSEATTARASKEKVAAAPLPEPLNGEPPASGGPGRQRVVAIITGAIGVVALGTGTYFGLQSASLHNDASSQAAALRCTSQQVCYGPGAPQVVDLGNRAITAGNASTAAFAVGGVALLGAAVLWFSAPASRPAAAPKVGVGVGIVDVAGTW